MKKLSLSNILIGSFCFLSLAILVLGLHIYMVMSPKAPDGHTVAMARIDLKQDITKNDAGKITTWLYQQKGVDHVLCNPNTDIVVFTFYPVKADADMLTAKIRSQFNMTNAVRFIPTQADLESSCPVAANSNVFKVYHFIQNIL